MTLRLLYRLYGGENLKGRPAFYNKRTALASFLRAAEFADADAVILADGPIPDDMRAMAAQRSRIVQLEGGPLGMRASYLAALRFPVQQRWDDDDIVYFSEDDYLHLEQSFVALQTASDQIPSAAYFALYASTPRNPCIGPGVPHAVPADWMQQPEALVDGHGWVNVPSTASTFGARVGALRADLGIFRQGMIPYPSRLLDHETCLVYQGRFPYTPTELFLGPQNTRFREGYRALAANAVLTPFRMAFEVRSLTRRKSPHLLYAADPNYACHMETEFLSPGTDWSECARQAREWAAASGHPIGASRPSG
jgi:hypothetical protein